MTCLVVQQPFMLLTAQPQPLIVGLDAYLANAHVLAFSALEVRYGHGVYKKRAAETRRLFGVEGVG